MAAPYLQSTFPERSCIWSTFSDGVISEYPSRSVMCDIRHGFGKHSKRWETPCILEMELGISEEQIAAIFMVEE
jgi:hypothetical protein